ncbi:Proline iminopeptidase [Taphrina deformans PYCC 5710]|uniref:Proline iminopeptidase n=1 Tax=Taphrina deformans (strain PYCC 5710 / ATCC 11124 / CBS 356.35 / IMI 108563 / JCM 9778 / NBRC 8474) TaxID=1097556 RepID=R4X7U3_TAPDE|nr:Proline iminopeptidase [Taphrina deformans PYCC 5710]|eukprot:CCG81276.1 Proline iminopeptidase [Taphrina deformans PYCC 5710]
MSVFEKSSIQAAPVLDTSEEFSTEAYRLPGISLIDRHFKCPVDYDQPDGTQISVFLRQCSRAANSDEDSRRAPRLLYLQGGPGFECSATVPSNSGMIKTLLDKGYVILFLDQRGTGMSSPIDSETILLQGNLDAQVSYCKHFRADSIVKDCELIRQQLGIKSLTLLGQSFGGFCILTYLSLYPESLDAVIITGGMAPICHDHPDSVYYRLTKKLIRWNENYYERYPKDVSRIRTIVTYLDQYQDPRTGGSLKTPNGGALTSRRFRQLGIELGMHGGIDRIHNIITRLSSDLDQHGFITFKAREMVENALHYDGNPIYAILHEAIYCQNSKSSNWSSQRVLATYPEFDSGVGSDKPIYFYGENIFPWMFEDYAQLRPLKALADKLAQESWGPLYDLERLGNNTVPIAASCYIMDMYVEIDLAIESLQAVACTKDLVTNRWLHNALRHAPEEVLGYLLNLLQDVQP